MVELKQRRGGHFGSRKLLLHVFFKTDLKYSGLHYLELMSFFEILVDRL